MTESGDLYEILGVPKDASEQDIKKAFRALAKELHPDVSGDDPVKVARFKEVAAAYETLADTEKRAAYDRARNRRSAGPRVWQSGFYPPPGGNRPPPPKSGDLDLEDIFTDFNTADFGFGQKRERRREEPRSGRDVSIAADVPADVARNGGTVTVAYARLRRVDGALTLVRAEELHELRVPPGTRHGETLRVPRLGDAGEAGGPYGDLVVDVRVIGRPTAESAPGGSANAPKPADGPRMRLRPEDAGEVTTVVDISIAEAVLGGRIPVATSSGLVKIAVPAGTSSGAKFRLRGKGPLGPGGVAKDLLAEVRIVVPRELDDESRRLIERFAELNPRVE